MSKLAASLLFVSLINCLGSTSAFVSPTADAVARTSRFLPALATTPKTVLHMAADFSLDPKKTALVLIEYQNEFASPGGKLNDAVKECMEKTNMLENSRKLAEEARAAGCSIIHCPISFEKVRGCLISRRAHCDKAYQITISNQFSLGPYRATMSYQISHMVSWLVLRKEQPSHKENGELISVLL